MGSKKYNENSSDNTAERKSTALQNCTSVQYKRHLVQS